MNKFIFTILLLWFNLANAQQFQYDKQFFVNSTMENNYFYSNARYLSPSWLNNSKKKLPVVDNIFFTPGNALQLHYLSARNGWWRADILFNSIRGVDNFSAASHLVFRLYLPSAISDTLLPLIAVAKDSSTVSSLLPLQNYTREIGTKKWITIAIPLADFHFESGTANINVIQFSQQGTDQKEHILYIDQVELLPSPNNNTTFQQAPQLTSAIGYEKHIDITWRPVTDTSIKYLKVYRSRDGKTFYPVGMQSPWISRYADYTDTIGRKFYYRVSSLNKNYLESAPSNIVSAATHPMDDSALLDMVQQAHFRYYWEGAETNSGLALENIPGRRHMIASGASGFGIMALIAGAERKFITRKEIADRFDKITSFLMKAEKFHGAFPHFIDGNTGEAVAFFGKKDNGGDLVETSFLMQGLLCARQYFNGNSIQEKLIRSRIDTLWKNIEWDWYRKTPGSKYLYWHWSPDQGWIINHKLIGWNETMITYILAICSPSHAIPASMYYSGWASQDAIAQKYRSDWGRTKNGSMYVNSNTYFGIPLKVGVSNGGPLFFTHYSYMGLDPHAMKDAYTDYFTNNRNIALINYRYCVENPEDHQGYGPGAWGLTASDGPWTYSADEPVPHADHGKSTPTGALASMPYLPEKAMDALKNYYRNYGKFLWGAYGFYDSFIPEKNWCSGIYMGLNQAPITVMIENYRTGLIWKLFMSSPEIQKGLKQIYMENPLNLSK